MTAVTPDAVQAALATVHDPEIHRPITDLGMVDSIDIADDGHVSVKILLTIAGCPMQSALREGVTTAVSRVAGVTGVDVTLGVMTDEQRREMRQKLQGPGAQKEILFNKPGNRTTIYAVTSGKGGVGKSSTTVNLAVTLAQRGFKVGVLDADIYGHSIPPMLGSTQSPTKVDDMMMPPEAHGVKCISIAQFTAGNAPVVWRGPMLHRALQQFLTDVYWGDLDFLLLDLPPGTGDIALSIPSLLPNSQLLIVTTPQTAAAEVAERSGMMAKQTRQNVAGVIENMSWMELPDGSKVEMFGSGGGMTVAMDLTRILGYRVNVLGQVPMDVRLREGGDEGTPIVLTHPESTVAQTFNSIVDQLLQQRQSLVGKSLGINPN
ncbi:MAG: Mrp/NBP35 family ATP-binding protein [Lawsonella sp.]|uniref:Mrp/NBP35 family ATP-binding protein n=1 Tax=Lawsonella sp. TaxID=2041415 RepID=UPI002A763916|nr:Mrp/NBP35 family ATP-binding protein [Lawsonella sp.]MDY2979089.1 Mrp/NBP35 family ATP-binding protein [Lawsonella sp.]